MVGRRGLVRQEASPLFWRHRREAALETLRDADVVAIGDTDPDRIEIPNERIGREGHAGDPGRRLLVRLGSLFEDGGYVENVDAATVRAEQGAPRHSRGPDGIGRLDRFRHPRDALELATYGGRPRDESSRCGEADVENAQDDQVSLPQPAR